MGTIAPLIPSAKHGGRKWSVDVREVVNGLMYILSTGCQWRAVSKDLPPRSTLFEYFDLWDYDGTLDSIHHTLCVKCREAMGREVSPTAGVIDSQSVKGAERGGLHRTVGLRRGQETPHPCRYGRSPASRHRASRQYPGSRWWRSASSSFPEDGSSKGLLPGTEDAAVSPRILKTAQEPPELSLIWVSIRLMLRKLRFNK
jgi:transposase